MIVFKWSYLKKLWSMRFILATSAVSSLIAMWAILPVEWQVYVPVWLIKGTVWLDVVLCAGAGISKAIKQNVTPETTK